MNSRPIPVLAAVTAAIAIVWLRWWINPRFYFVDDAQAQFYPAVREIARLLGEGQAPWLTLRAWFGGNFAGEYVYGVFNPVSLLAMWWTGSMADLAVAAAAFSSVCVALCAVGGYLLARRFGASPGYASVAGFAIATNSFLLFWYATAWVAGLVGFVFFLFAALGLLVAAERRAAVLPAALAVALLWTAGYPASVVATGLFVGCVLLIGLWAAGDWRGVARVLVASVSGTLLALPALYPAWALFAESLRAEAGVEVSTFLSASFAGLLSFAFPSFLPVMDTWGPMLEGKHGVVDMPMYYIGWFLLPALVFFDWGRLRRAPPREVAALLLAVLAFFVLCRIPSLNLFRWSFKYLPYYGAALVLLGVVILSRPESLRVDARRTGVGLALIAALAGLAMASSADRWPLHVVSAVALAGGLLGLAALIRRHAALVPGLLLLAALGGNAVSALLWTRSTELPDQGLDARVANAEFLGVDGRGHTVLNAASPFCCDPDERRWFAFGNAGYLSANHFVNGYSTMQPANLHRELCINHAWGLVCDAIFERLFAIDPETGVPVSDLFGIDVVAVPNGPKMASFARLAGDEWQRTRVVPTGAEFRRSRPGPQVGTLSFVSPGVRVTAGSRDGLDEQVLIAADAGADRRLLLFGRAWYPGYRARLDGEAVPVIAHRGYLVGIALPPTALGDAVLRLEYRLPGLPWSGWLALVGLALAVVYSRRPSRSS